MAETDSPDTPAAAFEVLARKYRPQDFDALIGQDALVRTLSNAIQHQRVASAYMLTGVRGVGKTTTARIIAKALNCEGEDGNGAATPAPCGTCRHCRSITQSRHIDVLELDAASRTGVGDIRELLDNVQYLPVEARTKVYIIDEVHMLSNQAFNALLKTLEEPPAHVVFIFATTEIRKVPITVLSRCQRFDLRRVDMATLIGHFEILLQKENLAADADALQLIARAAEGSVRDGLSLLDQAIAHSTGKVDAETVRDMLGLADRAALVDLFGLVMAGKTADALLLTRQQYDLGADPLALLQNLLEFTHWVTRQKVSGSDTGADTATEFETERGRDYAERLSMPSLTRAWQMLLKGVAEVRDAPSAFQALEMLIIRLCYTAALPPPAELIRTLQNNPVPAAATASAPTAPPAPSPGPAAEARPPVAEAPADRISLHNFDDVLALVEARREGTLLGHLRAAVRLVHFEQGRIELQQIGEAPANLLQQLGLKLGEWTGERWMIVQNNQSEGAPTVLERQAAARDAEKERLSAHPLVQTAQKLFPGAELKDWRPLAVPDQNDNRDNGSGDSTAPARKDAKA